MTFEEFLAFERENACEKLQVDGFHYWWYIRYTLIVLCGCLPKVQEGQLKAASSTSWKHKISSFFQFVFVGWKHSPFRKGEKNSLFILQDAIFYNPEEAYYECPRTQSVMKYWQGKKTLISDYYTQYNANAFPPQFPETVFIVYPFMLAKVKGQLWKLIGWDKKKKRKIAASITPILRVLKEQYHISIEADLAFPIYQQYLYWKEDYKYYEHLIKWLKPYGVVESCYYSPRKMALNEVAKKYQVPVVELQHGVMGRAHQAYNSYIMDNRTFPDYELVFSEYWKECTRFPLPKERVIPVGYPYLEERIKKSRQVEKQGMPRALEEYSEGRVLLVIGSSELVDEELKKFLLEVCAYVKENKISGFRILYKMHPRFMDAYEALCALFSDYADILHVVEKEEGNLYDCFAVADEQISVISTGLFEGLAYGLRTYVCKSEKYRTDSIEELCSKGYASFVNRPEQLFEEEGRCEKDGNGLWMENSGQRLRDTLQAVLEKKE